MILISCFFATCAWASELDDAPAAASDQNAPQVIELTISPAAEPRPALKYRLFPSLAERTPGNGATYYYRALVQQKMLPQDYWQQYNDKSEGWLTKDPAKYPKEEVQKWLASQQAVLTQLKTAANRERCEWDLRVQDLRGLDVIGFHLAEFQEARTLARFLQLLAHDQIMAGRFDDALESLRLGYQLAHDAGKPPFLVGGLIGIAISQIMNQELTLLIESSDRNYYWAIATLPQPLIDLRSAMEMESALPTQMFPFLKDAETAERTADEWRRLAIECVRGVEQLDTQGKAATPGWQGELLAAAFMAKLYPAAKEQLIADGMSRERVEGMPVGQVVAIQTARATQYAYDELFKLSLLPLEESVRRMPSVMQSLVEKDYIGPPARLSGKAGVPIASLLLPSVQAVRQAEVRMARGFAGLSTIEAIRMHAAAGGGKLPPSLSDITIVAVPNDPITGKPLAYKHDATTGTATLELPATKPGVRGDGKRYIIRLK